MLVHTTFITKQCCCELPRTHTHTQADLVLKFITTYRSLNQIQDPEAVSQVIFRLTLQKKNATKEYKQQASSD